MRLALVFLMMAGAQAAVPFTFRGGTPGGGTGNGLLNGLVAYYRFEEATGNALDATGGGRNLTVSGSSAAGAGKVSGARELSSTTFFYHVDDAAYDPGTDDYTIAFWVKLAVHPAEGEAQTILSKWDVNGNDGSWVIQAQTLAGGVSGFAVAYTDNGLFSGQPLNPPLTDGGAAAGKWYFVCVRFDHAGGMCYIDARAEDGVSWASDSQSMTDIFDSGAELATSGWSDGVGALIADDQRISAGTLLDELGFWRRKLTDTDRDLLFGGGAGLPYSSFTH